MRCEVLGVMEEAAFARGVAEHPDRKGRNALRPSLNGLVETENSYLAIWMKKKYDDVSGERTRKI